MAELKKISEATKAQARKAGRIPKAPKKPKRSANVGALQAYIERHNAWCDKINALANSQRTREALRKKVFGIA